MLTNNSSGIRSADVFLIRALEKIISDKEVKKSQNSQLKKQCESALSELRKESKIRNNSDYIEINDAEKYFLPFELACKCKSPRVVETSLDCIQKLVAHGYLNESSKMSPDSTLTKPQFIQRLIKTICLCFDGPDIDDIVQLQIIKSLLTILTCPHIEVHEQTMLLPIKTCYNIQISSRSLVNQASARAALTQIINTVLTRLEASSQAKKEKQKEQKIDSEKSLQQQQSQNIPTIIPPEDDVNSRQVPNSETISLNDSTQNDDQISNLNEIIENNLLINNTEHYKHIYMDILHSFECEQLSFNLSQTIDELSQTESNHNEISDLMCTMLDAICEEIDPQPPQTSITLKPESSSQEQIKPELIKDYNPQPEVSKPIPKDPELIGIDDPYELDTYLMFRAFCKLSLRPITQDSNTPDIKTDIDIKSKILSLQLILATLQNAKSSFKQSPHMINAIRRYLCVSLSKNGVSPINDVFELSLAIFVALLADYKQHLKKQIEVFFREIIIFLLETPTSSFEHKWLVIQALTHVCANAQCVVDLYINYDCDLQSTNIFARLVNVLSKKALGRQTVDLSCSQIQLNSLRLKGLECLVSILKCMVEWSKDLYTNPNVQSNLGPENRPNEVIEHSELKIQSYDSSNSLNSSNSNSNNYNPSDFEMIKCKKELWEKGIDLFSKKPKKGLQFLQDNELLGRSAEEIACFFLEDNRLDKTAIGDFLGENEKFNKEVMYSYVDQMDFYGMEIVSALRLFLEGFRLPGEAQKIDRLMEKFAARYHELNKKFANHQNTDQTQNQSVKNPKRNMIKDYYFESADAVYVLAFSIIMLATDLHSASVKKKMTKEAYINMNRGINENKDLPKEFLENIYDQIAESEIKVKPSLNSNTSRPKAETEKQRKLLYNMEIEQVTQTARSLMESVYHVPTNFTSAKHGEHIMPMFKLAWTPFLAAFSIALQDSDDYTVVDLCLTGIRCAIRISCIFHLELERDAYIQALSRFTLLSSNNLVHEMKPKNVECIKSLITIAHTDGNYLGKSWYEILKCISQLEIAQSVGVTVSNVPHTSPNTSASNTSGSSLSTLSMIKKESSILKNIIQPSVSTISTISINGIESLDSKTLANIQMQIGDSLTQSVVVAVDRIFTGSFRLDGDAIVEFVKWLCYVSEDELAFNPPRMYSLQKIVEISYYNMGRIRLQWTRIWNILGEHFNKAGCNSNEEVAFFAVDSLRQLTMKFLEKGEFANFRFQKDFLKPFEHIMKRNGSYTIRDMVVQCIAQMVKSQAQNIKSGWKNVFGVFHLAASQNDERILNYAFDVVSEIIRNYVEKYFWSLIDSFQDAIKCLSEFACNSSSPDISIEAIGLIRHCAVFVADKPNAFVEQGYEDLKSIPESDLVWMKGWFPILFELSCIINRCKLDVRTRGLTVMFEIMKTYGETYRSQWWKELFNIVFRIFDNMKLPEAQIEKAEWMTTTCNHALYAIVDVFSQYYDTISSILVDDLYTQLKWCVKQDNEQLARSGTNCFENFVITNGVKFSEDVWRKTCACLCDIFNSTIPIELLSWRPDQESLRNGFDSSSNNHLQIQQTNSFTSPTSTRDVRRQSSNSINSIYSDDTRSKIPRSRVPTDLENKVFQHLLIKCVVQLELIQTIDNIVFYPTTSKKEDANYIAAAQALSSPTMSLPPNMFMNEHLFHDEYGMYVHLNNEQLFLLVDCLEESYEFSRKFNCNHEQRNLLWKAGFKGKDKPNLLKHETQSLACMLRILFKMLTDESRKDYSSKIQSRLIKICQGALDYYLMLSSDGHRDSWDNIILLLLTKIYKLDTLKFKMFSSILYRQLCDILSHNLKPELRNILREMFIQIGYVNSIQTNMS
ncbi:unnamed protein product [Brachionus calyciflorus]|uniref:SEC7 domain-containing protein n=1 Tax=Brachionus calyciflorus TaxID=104777 RepID=A0A813MGW5_9BILA|nr:unnamed protein product [Brachionus calyciflorus]